VNKGDEAPRPQCLPQHGDGVYIDNVLLCPGWLYLDAFARPPAEVYGGPSRDLCYWTEWSLDRVIDREAAASRRREQQELDELNDALTDVTPLGVQWAEQERDAWLVRDVWGGAGDLSEESEDDADNPRGRDAAEEGYL
jgi:hypothetical protein